MTCETTSKPLASILIGNYNYGRFLREAIDSALNQTYPNIEVVVVDDGSTDDSRQIIASYRDRIVPVLKENGGQASAFNAGFAASHGDWILFLDSDDCFLTSKAEKILKLAEQNPSAGIIVHSLEYCGADGGPTSFSHPQISKFGLVDAREALQGGRITAFMPATSGLCFRRDILERILPMPEGLRGQPDNYIKLAGLSLSPVLLVPEALARQRIHDRSRYTYSFADHSDTARLGRAQFRAELYFHVRKTLPALKKLAWKQYGGVLAQLTLSRSQQARTLRKEIRHRYSVLEPSPQCLFHIVSSFGRVFAGALLRELGGDRGT